jgi:hypothetical protein
LTQQPAGVPQWASRARLRKHFNRHQDDFRKHNPPLVFQHADQYDTSARETIRVGTRFTYKDRATNEWRVGYFDPATGRFTAVSENGATILTHFPTSEAKVRGFPQSDYP